MELQHETLARAIDQHRALAAQGFGCERGGIAADVDGGRMELHEFGIGDDGAGARRHRQPDAARLGRIGGHPIELADAAGGEHGCAGGEFFGLACGTARDGADDPPAMDDRDLRRV